MNKNRSIIDYKKTKQTVERNKILRWPNSILNFKGIPNHKAQRFESLRNTLVKPKDDPFY